MLGLLPPQGFPFRVLCLGNSLPQHIFWLVSFCYLGLCSNVNFSERTSLTTPPKEPHTYSVSPLTPISTYSIFFIDLPLCKIKLFIYLLCCLLKKRMQTKWEQSGFCSRMYAGHPEYFLAYSDNQIYLLMPVLPLHTLSSERLSNLPKVTQLQSTRGEVQNKIRTSV